MASENLINLRTRIEMGTVEFEDSMTRVNRQLKILRNETKLSKSETELFGKSNRTLGNEMKSLDSLTEGLTVSIKQQKAEYERLREANIKLNGENAKSTKGMDKVANNIQRLSRELSDAERKMQLISIEMAKQNSSLYQWGNKLESGGKTLEKFGKGMGTVANEWMKLSGAMALGVGVVVKSAIDWESAWTGVLKTVDGTPQELEALSQGLRDMSQELPVSANELAGIAEAAGQLGIETGKIEKFTEVVAALGVTTNMSAETAAQEFARLANITGMSQDDFDRLGSSIVELGNNYATTEAEISTMALRLAAAGSQIGMSEADILGLSATLSSLGIEAEAGGSAISKVLINMQVASSTGLQAMVDLESATGFTRRELELMASNNGKDFKELASSIGMTTSEIQDIMKASKNLENFAEVAGMTGAEFQKAFGEDAIGAMMKFIEGLGGIDTESESAIEKLDAMGISEIRLRDALLRLAGNSDLVTRAVSDSNRAWDENTALQNEASLRYQTVQSQLQILRNKLTDVAVSAGEELLPAIIDLVDMAEPLIDSVKEAVKRFSELDESTKQNIIRLGGFVIAGGPVLKFLAGFTENTGKLTGALGKGLKAITGLDKPVEDIGDKVLDASRKTDMFSTGVGKLVLSIGKIHPAVFVATGAIAAGVVAWKLWGEEAYKSSERTRKWGTDIGEVADEAITDFQTLSDEASSATDTMMFNVEDGAERAITAYSSMAENIKEDIHETITATEEGLADLPESVRSIVEKSLTKGIAEQTKYIEEIDVIQEKITGIYEKALAENREITDNELTVIENYHARMAEIRSETLNLSAEDQRKVMAVMRDDLAAFSQEQLRQRLGFLDEERKLVEERYSENQKLLEDSLVSGELSRKEYNDAMLELNREELDELMVIGAEYKKVWDERGDIPLEAQEKILNDMGLTLEDVKHYLALHNEAVAESGRLTIETSENASKKVREANNVWNDMVLEGEENMRTFIQSATESEQGWNDLEYVVHNAELDTNSKQIIKEAMMANGTWWDLEFPPHWAEVESNVRTEAKAFLESEGVWQGLDLPVQTAILDSNSKDQVKQILIDYGIWDALDYRRKKAFLESNTKEVTTQATYDHATWEGQDWSDKQPKIDVTTNARDVARTAQDEINGVTGKTVSIITRRETVYSSSMANSMTGPYATYARGTDYHPGGLAVLGDGGKREPYLTPQGSFGISPNTDTMYALPEGTKVWSSIAKFRQEARQKDILKPLVGKLPHYATGTNDSFLGQTDSFRRGSNNNGVSMNLLTDLITRVERIANAPIFVEIDIDGKRITRELASPMKKELERIDLNRAIVTKGRR